MIRTAGARSFADGLTSEMQPMREEQRVLDPVKVERAESEIDKFIASRADSRKQANEEAAAWARADRERRERAHAENRALWCEHFRRSAVAHLLIARDFRRRARALEANE